jgi:hypothetical protein
MLGKKDCNRLVNVICNDSYAISGRGVFKEEFVTCGGIDLKSVNLSTLESRHVPHLFFAGEVLDVSFRNHKKLLDTEEYDSILYLFELAKATGSALTIPTVDFAYEKYLDAMIESLPEQIQKNARARFREVADSIIEMYDRLFEFFKARYPEVKCAMMSSKNKDLLELYYSKRQPFVDKTATRRIISGIQEKIESVKDYITLPALPYYFWGIKNVLEVDYLGETDSFWKCRKMHKGEMKLSALLYPIKISADGWRTLFSTERQYKEYIKEEDYGKR